MRTNRRPVTVGFRALVLGALLAAVLVPSGADAAAGELDPTFGDAGRAEPTFAAPWTEGHASAVDADGRLVVVGRRGPKDGDGGAWAVVRLTRGGQPDEAFVG